jgi:sugar lactone lactonase YvrE
MDVDSLGRLYVIEARVGFHRLRRIDPDGSVVSLTNTYDGNADCASLVTGGGDPFSPLGIPGAHGIFVDAQDRVLIADSGCERIVRLDFAAGTVTLLAGTGAHASAADGSLAVSSPVSTVDGVAVTANGDVFFTEVGVGKVRGIDHADGRLFTVQSGGNVSQLSVDSSDRLLFAERTGRIRRREANGTLVTLAGAIDANVSAGDFGSPLAATFELPHNVIEDADGRLVVADATAGNIRRFDASGGAPQIVTLFGAHPQGPAPLPDAKLYEPRDLVALPDGSVLAAGAAGRVLQVGLTDVDVVVGHANAAPAALSRAEAATLFSAPRGLAYDQARGLLYVVDQGEAAVRAVDLHLDGAGITADPAEWTMRALTLPDDAALVAPAGAVFDERGGSATLVIADEGDGCVKRVDLDGGPTVVLAGVCGAAGSLLPFLDGPTHIAISPLTGAVYVSDARNQRVVRVEVDGQGEPAGDARIVLGGGAGSGIPARFSPVESPGQLAVDAYGNLFVTSRTTVREVINAVADLGGVDVEVDGDGREQAVTIFGSADRSSFPESVAQCLSGLALEDDHTVLVADSCLGFLVAITPE